MVFVNPLAWVGRWNGQMDYWRNVFPDAPVHVGLIGNAAGVLKLASLPMLAETAEFSTRKWRPSVEAQSVVVDRENLSSGVRNRSFDLLLKSGSLM